MKHLFICFCLLCVFLTLPLRVMALEAPPVPEQGREYMPSQNTDFLDAVAEIIQKSSAGLRTDMTEIRKTTASLLCACVLISLVPVLSEQSGTAAEITAAVLITALLLGNTRALIGLGVSTITELSEYGKLFMPVMAAAFAAQGSISASAALYAGTALFLSVLGKMITAVFIPLIYLFLAISSAGSAFSDDLLIKIKDMMKGLISWSLKTILTLFTTYMGITGVVSGTVDTASLKAAKVTMSTVVPVVGGILSEASESILVSAGVLKNAIGIYGVLAILSVFCRPFLKIGLQYLILKYTGVICGLFVSKKISGLIEDYSSALGLLLGITGSMCIMLLIGCICFLKGFVL